MKQLLNRVLLGSLTIGLLVYALKDISLGGLLNQFKQANYGWVGVFLILTLINYLLRGKRWQQALVALGYSSTTFRTTIAIQSGSVASMIVPGSGEVTRCMTISRTDGVPLSNGVGSVVAERVLDILMLITVLALTFALEITRMQQYLRFLTFVKPNELIGLVTLVGLLIFFIFYRLWRMPLIQSTPFAQKITRFGQGLREGFMAFRQLPNPILFVGLTIIGQVIAWLSAYAIMHSLKITHSLPGTAALTVVAVSSIGGLAVPTQGGIGTYHYFVSRALTLYGLNLEDAVVASTFMHAVSFAINLIISSLSFLIVPFLIAKQSTHTQPTATTEAPQHSQSSLE